MSRPARRGGGGGRTEAREAASPACPFIESKASKVATPIYDAQDNSIVRIVDDDVRRDRHTECRLFEIEVGSAMTKSRSYRDGADPLQQILPRLFCTARRPS